MSDASFRELLGLEPGATREQIRRHWRCRVMENHPDRFPPDRKSVQELRVIALNEAYASLMAHPKLADPAPDGGASEIPWSAGSAGVRPPAPAAGAVGRHRDPAYAYYKQGFL